MAVQKTITANATASLSASGTSTATGSITWTAPSFPLDVTAWESVMISGQWSWGGKGNITQVTINGTNTSADTQFNVSIAGKSSPLSITCVGNNKNATGSNFRWTDLVVTYTYTDPHGEVNTLYVQLNGQPVEVAVVYRKTNGVWVEVADITTLYQNAKYVRGD